MAAPLFRAALLSLVCAAGACAQCVPTWHASAMGDARFRFLASLPYDDGSGRTTYIGINPATSPLGSAILKWTAKGWAPVGVTEDGWSATALTEYRGSLIAGLSAMDGAGARIVKFEPATGAWITIGEFAATPTGLTAFAPALPMKISSLTVYGDLLIAGGRFDGLASAPRRESCNIAAYDGESWMSLGPALGDTASEVRTLLVTSNNELLAGGTFVLPGGPAPEGTRPAGTPVARWDGIKWVGVGVCPAASGTVNAMVEFGGRVIVGGMWEGTDPSMVTTRGVAALAGDGIWAPLGTGLSGPEGEVKVTGLTLNPFGNNLIVTGTFTGAGEIDMIVSNIAAWNGAFWAPLDEGVPFEPRAMYHRGAIVVTPGDGVMACGLTPWTWTEWSCLSYANCDGSVAAPAVNPLDFACFLSAFARGDGYANCDESITPPVLNSLDFLCFLERYRTDVAR